jgi:4-alpha-glucanotransferase
MPTTPSPALHALAEATGVATDFWDWQGRHTTVSAESIRTVLAALGIDAATDEAAVAALAEQELAPWRQVIAPTVVCRAGSPATVRAHVPHGTGIRLRIELEDGSQRWVHQVDDWTPPQVVDGREVGQAAFELPGDLPPGWHSLIAEVEADRVDGLGPDAPPARATVIVTPQRLELPESVRASRVTGVAAQLYQVRSEKSWGIGDLADLSALGDWAAQDLGAEFVLVNPLHAAEPTVPMEPSPYLPTTRRFANPIYLSVPAIAEVVELPEGVRARIDELATQAAAQNRGERVDRDAAWTAKREALRLIHAHGLDGARAAGYAAYVAREGEGLERFATWCALAEVHGLPWTLWPDELQDPDQPAVADFAAAHAEAVDFHRWLQWQLEEQLARVQRDISAHGMTVGVVHDLAVGVHPFGADSWSLGPALARGVTVGAPPDQFNQLGQNWNQPPWRPDELARLGYAPFRDMVRTVLRDSGGIRIDHIIGLFRLWWIPEGCSAAEGTYVRYDHEALIGILVLEASRAGAIVVGEDLGVVAPNVRDYLRERGILGTSILWFEWRDGQPLPPEDYRELALSSVTTHDLPPTAGYLALEHVDVRERLGLLTRSAEEERAAEQQSLDTVRAALVHRGLLDAGAGPESTVIALHRWLSHSPSLMLAMSLADLVGDHRAVNQPGTHQEYPNWCVPLADGLGRTLLLEDVKRSELAPLIAEALRGR